MKFCLVLFSAFMLTACGSTSDADDQKVIDDVYNAEKAIKESKENVKRYQDSVQFLNRMDSINRQIK